MPPIKPKIATGPGCGPRDIPTGIASRNSTTGSVAVSSTISSMDSRSNKSRINSI